MEIVSPNVHGLSSLSPWTNGKFEVSFKEEVTYASLAQQPALELGHSAQIPAVRKLPALPNTLGFQDETRNISMRVRYIQNYLINPLMESCIKKNHVFGLFHTCTAADMQTANCNRSVSSRSTPKQDNNGCGVSSFQHHTTSGFGFRWIVRYWIIPKIHRVHCTFLGLVRWSYSSYFFLLIRTSGIGYNPRSSAPIASVYNIPSGYD